MRSGATTSSVAAIRTAGRIWGRATTSRGMFLQFFYALREAGVPVGTQEWIAFLRALELGELLGRQLRQRLRIA